MVFSLVAQGPRSHRLAAVVSTRDSERVTPGIGCSSRPRPPLRGGLWLAVPLWICQKWPPTAGNPITESDHPLAIRGMSRRGIRSAGDGGRWTALCPPPRPRGGIGRRGRACRAGALSRRGDFQALLVTVLLTGMLSGAARATSAAERKTASIDSPSTFAAKSVSVVCGGNCARTAASTAA